MLKAYTQLLNQPHELWPEIAAGQKPTINVVNASRNHGTQTLFGQTAAEPGRLFKVTTQDLTAGKPLTRAEVDKLFDGVGYSITALEGESKVLFLVADNPADMEVIRAGLLAHGDEAIKLTEFLQNGGIFVELIPDEAGKFSSTMVVRTAAKVNEEISLLKLIKTGKIAETVVIDEAMMERSIAVARAQEAAGKTANLSKLEKIWRAAKPVASLLFQVLNQAGNVFLVRDIWKFVDTNIFNHELIYQNSLSDVMIADFKLNEVMQAGKTAILNSFGLNDGNPFLVSGAVEKVNLSINSFHEQFSGFIANLINLADPDIAKRHPEIKSWQPMVNGNMRKGMPVTFMVPGYHEKKAGPFGGVRHITSLILEARENDGLPGYQSEKPETQTWDLFNEQTGLPILAEVPESTQVIMSVEEGESGVGYFWQVVPVPEESKVELRYIGARKL